MTAPSRAVDASPTADAVRAALDEIERSAVFVGSQRHRRFLRHLVEQWLAGRTHELREITLGVTVFGRPAESFDPALDSIVRVEARRLRQRLQQYYAGEGRNASLRISLVAGRYVPTVASLSPAETSATSRPVTVCFCVSSLAAADDQIERFASALRTAIGKTSGLHVVSPSAPDRGDTHAQMALSVDGDGVLLQLGSGDDAADLGERHRLYAGHRLPQDASECAALISHATLLLLRFGVVAGWPLLRAPAMDGRRFPDALSRDLFDRARLAFRLRSLEGYRTSLALFQSLLEREPAAAEAHTGVARCLLALAGMIALPVRETLPQARAAAERALHIEADDGEARCVLAQVAFLYEHDWLTAQAHFVAGLQRAPNCSVLHHAYAFALMMRGEFDSAAVAYDIAALLDPLDVQIRVQAGLLPHYRRDYAAAVAHWQRLLEASPGNLIATTLIGAAHLAAGQPAAAIVAYDEALRRAPEHPIGWAGLAQARAMMGEREGADAALGELQRMAASRYVSPYLFAMVHTRRGDMDLAFDWLQRSATEPDFNFVCAAVDPTFDALHIDPRWTDLSRAHGLPMRHARSAANPLL